MKKIYSLNLDKEVIEKIDSSRDGVPRSPYINKILLKWLKRNKLKEAI